MLATAPTKWNPTTHTETGPNNGGGPIAPRCMYGYEDHPPVATWRKLACCRKASECLRIDLALPAHPHQHDTTRTHNDLAEPPPRALRARASRSGAIVPLPLVQLPRCELSGHECLATNAAISQFRVYCIWTGNIRVYYMLHTIPSISIILGCNLDIRPSVGDCFNSNSGGSKVARYCRYFYSWRRGTGVYTRCYIIQSAE